MTYPFTFLLSDKEPEKQAPFFVKSLPKESSVYIGDKITVDVKVSGVPVPEISWLKNEKPVQISDRIKTEFDGTIGSLTIEDADADDDAVYACCATNDSGSITCACEIVVDEPEFAPKFKEGLKSQIIVPGEEAEFMVEVDGNPEPKVEWYHNEKLVKDRGRYQLLKEKNGKLLLIIDKCKELDSGVIKCVAVNKVGECSCSVDLKVQDESESRPEPEPKVEPKESETTSKKSQAKPKESHSTSKKAPAEPEAPTIHEISPTKLEVTQGTDVRLEVEITGNPVPKIEWLRGFKKVMELKDKVTIEKEGDKSILVIKNIKSFDADTYKCVATNNRGKDNKSFTVKVSRGKHRIQVLRNVRIFPFNPKMA